VLKYDYLDTTTGPLLMTTSDSQSVRKTRWYSPTVGRFLFAILALLKGHTVVITVTATEIGLLLIAGGIWNNRGQPETPARRS
jgi:hypothetical protein